MANTTSPKSTLLIKHQQYAWAGSTDFQGGKQPTRTPPAKPSWLPVVDYSMSGPQRRLEKLLLGKPTAPFPLQQSSQLQDQFPSIHEVISFLKISRRCLYVESACCTLCLKRSESLLASSSDPTTHIMLGMYHVPITLVLEGAETTGTPVLTGRTA